jgi:hypothetical protein
VGQGTGGAGGGTGGVGQGTGGVGGGTGGVGPGTGGGGKGSMMFGATPNDGRPGHSTVEIPDGYTELGEVASYREVFAGATGVAKLDFTTGSAIDGLTTLLLDTCHGSEDILDAVDRFTKPLDGLVGWIGRLAKISFGPSKLVAIANPNPIYYDLIDYSSLRGDLFLALPLILYRGLKEGDPEYLATSRKILDHFAAGLNEPVNGAAKRAKVLDDYSILDHRQLIVRFKDLGPAVEE